MANCFIASRFSADFDHPGFTIDLNFCDNQSQLINRFCVLRKDF